MRLTRKQALAAIYGAGAQGDQAAFMRLYVEHRLSYAVALAEYRRGAAFGAWVARRDRMSELLAEHRDALGRDGVASL